MIVLFGTERAGFRGATWRRLSAVRRVGVSHFSFGQFRGGLTDYGMMHTRQRDKHDQRDHAEQNAEDSGALMSVAQGSLQSEELPRVSHSFVHEPGMPRFATRAPSGMTI